MRQVDSLTAFALKRCLSSPQPLHTHNAPRPALALCTIALHTACASLVGRGLTSPTRRDFALSAECPCLDRREATRKARARTTCGGSRTTRRWTCRYRPMSITSVGAHTGGVRLHPHTPLFDARVGAEQQAGVIAAMRASLADDALPALPGDMRKLVAEPTWAHVAETMRLAESSQWSSGLAVSKSAMGHQMLWLMVGGDSPSPRQFQDNCHKALRLALVSQIVKPFEAEAAAEARRAKKAGGMHDILAARATVAKTLKWSAPADVLTLRRLMANPAGAAAALDAARSRVAVAQGTLPPPASPHPT